jgi:streptogramin lyase
VGIASSGEAVWAISPDARIVSRIDPQTNLVEPYRLDEVPDDIVAGAGGVWVGHTAAGSLTRLDPATGAVVARVELDTEPLFLATGDGALWVLGLTRLVRIDPNTNRAVASLPLELARRPGPEPYVVGGLVAGDGAVWIADASGSEVLRIATR